MFNLATFVRDSALQHPDKTAIRFRDKDISYRQLDAMANQIANFLAKQGIGVGDKVALSCPNLPYFPAIYYGILKAGGVVVPLNILLKSREIAYHLTDSGAKAYFAFEGSDELPMAKMAAEALHEAKECKTLVIITTDPKSPGPIPNAMTLGQILATSSPNFEMAPLQESDTAVIIYTSGTTGKPKGAELTHFNIAMNVIVTAKILENKELSASDHVLCLVLPLFHSFGQTVGMNTMIYSGGQITMLPRFDAKQTLQTICDHKVTVFIGVPTMYWAMLNELKTWPMEKVNALRNSLKLCASGGAAMPVELLQNVEKLLGVPVLEGYGLSETSPVASFNHQNRPRKAGSIGHPVWGVEMQLVDPNDNPAPLGEVGEIAIRGHNVMKGYYNRPEETKEVLKNGWFHTGDIGKMDKEGYFFIVDRVKDMIIRGGFKIYPRELEEILMTHPAISMVAVVGIPSEEHKEEIKAFVVLKDGSATTPEEIIAWSKEKFAAYKYPRFVEIRKELPLGPTGKILKRALK